MHYNQNNEVPPVVPSLRCGEKSDYDAIHWYNGNIVNLLYPKANLKSQRISEFLKEIGTTENRIIFQLEYINFIINHYNPDKNILIDSTGLPNNIKIPITCKNIHHGKVSNEIRLILVVQKTTGIPLFYYAVPGNIVDVSTLERIFLHLESLSINIENCVLDAGYCSTENYDLFYDEDHKIKIGFLIRIKSIDKLLKQMIYENLETLDSRENFIKYEDRYLFIVKKEVLIGNNNPAWMYLGLDISRIGDEHKNLLKKAKKKNLSDDDVYNAMQEEGLFGMLSNHNYPCDALLPAYFCRQSIEQTIDFAKNYTKLLPLRTLSEETLHGHLLLSYISTCTIKLIQLKLKETNLFLGSRLTYMRNQKCTIYKTRIVTDYPQKEANETYKIFSIECPAKINITNDRLDYNPPNQDIKAILPDKINSTISISDESNTTFNNSEISSDTNSDDIVENNINSEDKKVLKKRGRPPGSKNKNTLEKEANKVDVGNTTKRGRGRPAGSKNKKTFEKEANTVDVDKTTKRGRGRPAGSKNKKTLEKEAKMIDGQKAQSDETYPKTL